MTLHEYVVRQIVKKRNDLTQSYWIEIYDKAYSFMSIVGYIWVPIIALTSIVVYHLLHVAS